ncbi:MAG: PAS domain S-box protein [Ectothiorhodospiraceae bacterium]|nr:PAS domain S-box protein [Chromatiales bacterium]MCP5153797.1 PAS domain S-box protein [Ectothiorhodospiraceae bacterium]
MTGSDQPARGAEAFSASPLLLQTVIDLVPGTLHVKDRDLRYCMVNRFFLEQWGLTRDQVIGRSHHQVFGDEHDNAVEARDREVLETGRTLPFYEVEYPSGEGGLVTLWASKVPLLDADGVVTHVLTFGLDITARREMERRLAENERLQSSLVEKALDCIVVLDAAGDVVEFNPAAEAVFGYRRDEVLGRSFAERMIPPGARERHRDGLERHLRTGERRMIGRQVRTEGMRRDGTVFPVELAVAEVVLGSRRLFTAYLRDLTAEHEAQREIARQRDMLYQSEKMAALGGLLAGVSHELNNPLSVVVGRAITLEEKLTDPRERESVQRLRMAAERCARIVRTFLAMARRSEPERAPTDLAALARNAVELTAYGARTAGIEVVLDLPDDLPTVMVDADQLVQVVVNLLVNAQQALGEIDGSRRLEVRAWHDRPQGMVHLAVRDNGPGIPAHVRTRVFEPFFTTKPVGAGTGVGLAVSHAMVEAHGGTLRVDSAPGHGAEFVVSLPVSGAVDESMPTSPAGRGAGVGSMVLVVDDEHDVADLMADCLELDGFEVERVGDGREALRRLERRRYDAVVCDVRMPGLDGPAVLRHLAERDPDQAARLVLVTGDVLGVELEAAIGDLGCVLLEKPFAPDDLRRAVRAARARGRARGRTN